jgi:hypothetical protein
MFTMTNSKKIEYASVDITTPCLTIIDGQVVFTSKTESSILTDFEVPDHVNTQDELDLYLNDLLNESGYDIACISSIYVHEWNEV